MDQLRTFNKRIGFLVSSQTLIPHGGIGQFAKSFCELMDNYSIKVDIITDKKPKNIDDDFIKNLKATIIFPEESLPYTDHSAIFMYEDSFCYERMANFRNAIIKALTDNLYDTLVCNTYETVQVASTLGIDEFIQIIAYTHLESQIFKQTKNPFLGSANEMMRHQLKMNNITIGTQSKYNQLEFENAVHLPIPISEQGLLQKNLNYREGVLFIGRWEEGKNPELFVELIHQTKLPARIMTNANGAKKFEERFKALGITDYKIAISITGQEKVDFITSARVAFNPSTVESYGMALYEQLGHMPTFVLKNQRWTGNFIGFDLYETTKKDMAEDIFLYYTNYDDPGDWYDFGNLDIINQEEKVVFHKWNQCFMDFQSKQSNSNVAKICTETTVVYTDFIKTLNRRIACIDDFKSVLSNKHKFRVIYTEDNTYLTKDPMFKPVEQVIGMGLFEGI